MKSNLYIWNLAYSVTNKCNLRCSHCYTAAGSSMEDELDLQQIEHRIVKPAASIGTKYITFTGGEPFMRNDFFNIIDLTHHNGIGVSIATNGMLLDPNMIAKLRDAKVDRIQISLEGSTARLNDAIRGTGVFSKLTGQVIPQLLDAGLFVAISFTPTAKNGFDIAGMARLCIELGIPSLSIRRYSNTGRAKENALAMSVKQGKELADTIFQLKQDYKRIIKISSGDPISVVSNPDIDKYTDGNYMSGCTAGITSLAIDSIGNIKPCTRANCIIGNVLFDNLVTIWNENDILLKLRDRNNLLGKCGFCKYKMLCGGCRVEALNNSQNIFEEDDKCWMY